MVGFWDNAICTQPPPANLAFTLNKIPTQESSNKRFLAKDISEIFFAVFVFLYKYMVGPIPPMCNVGPLVSQCRLQWDPTVLSQMHSGEKAPF